MESNMEIPQKTTNRTTKYPVILLLGIYLKECKLGCSRDICTPMFIAALFTIAKLWKRPRCPTTAEWIKKIFYIYIYMHTHTHQSEYIYIYIHTHTGVQFSCKKRMKLCCLQVSG
jgi:hypothetical protein